MTSDADNTAHTSSTRFHSRSWRTALFVVFGLSGLSVSTWSSRVPAVEATLHVSTTVIGDVVLAMSVGAVVGLVAAPVMSHRLGVRGGIVAALGSTALGLAIVGTATSLLTNLPLVLVGMILIGFGNGSVDVIMNVSAAAVERKLRRTTMPMMHAMFSVGTVAGAAVGALAAALGIVVAWHDLIIAVFMGVIAVVAVRFIPEIHQEAAVAAQPLKQGTGTATPEAAQAASTAGAGANAPGVNPNAPGADSNAPGTQETSPATPTTEPSTTRVEPSTPGTKLPEAHAPAARLTLGDRLRAWQDVTLIFIGVVMLGMAFAEGSANDWIALASVTGHHRTQAEGALILDVFVIAMTVGRIAGGIVVDRVGRVLAIRITALCGILGLLLFINASAPWAYVVGVALWGLGASLGFPLGISAAADDPRNATLRVSTVAMVGYCSFLVGPPLIGWLAGTIGILPALYAVLVLLVASLLASGAVRKRSPDTTEKTNNGSVE